jgi:hypothetical protein
MWAQSLPPQARSPRVRHPDRTKCTGVLGAVKNEGPWGGAHAPFLTAPARAGSITRKVGMKKRAAPGRTKKLRDNKMDRTLPLDKNCPIQACSPTFSGLASATARHTPNTNAPSMVRRRRRLGRVLDLGHQSGRCISRRCEEQSCNRRNLPIGSEAHVLPGDARGVRCSYGAPLAVRRQSLLWDRLPTAVVHGWRRVGSRCGRPCP